MLKFLKNLFYPVLFFFSVLNREITKLRFYLFLKNKPKLYAGIATVSLGNLQMGGGGKTPLCIDFLKRCVKKDVSFIHSSRAYKSKSESKGAILHLSNENMQELQATQVGDEPLMTMLEVQQGTFILGKKRKKLIKTLGAQYNHNPFYELLLLEDAYQHFSIFRDLDVLLIDVTCAVRDFAIFPLGTLRESPESLWRADIIMLTKVNQVSTEQLMEWKAYLENAKRKHTEILEVEYLCQEIISIDQQTHLKSSSLKSKRIVLFSGIANPKSFENLISSLGAEIIKTYKFSDHAVISRNKLAEMVDYATQNNAIVLCTEKDAVKIRSFSNSDKLFYSKLSIKFLSNGERTWNGLLEFNVF